MQVIKRDGRHEDFDFSKVKIAISRANNDMENPCSDETIEFILDKIEHRLLSLTKTTIGIEEIQDLIVSYLKKYSKRLYKHYYTYRQKRASIRDAKDNGKYYETILQLVNNVSNDTSKENSNKDATQIHVIRDLVAGETSKKLYREHVMPAELKELHDKGIIHVHDCDYRLQKGITNCELSNIDNVLQYGTMMNDKLIEKPHSLRTACTITSQVIASVSSSTYGGQTITMTHLAPFYRESRNKYERRFKDIEPLNVRETLINRLLEDELKDSIQTLLYQLNTLSTTNGQSPFITLFLYPNENPEYKKETMLLCKEVLRQRIQGMKSKTGDYISPTFPKLVVCITEDMLNPHHPDYEFSKLCAECVAKRMVPDFLSEKNIKKIKEGQVVPPMGCRSFLHPWKNENGEYEIYGRNNLGVISINLPYIALQSNTLEEFYTRLGDMIDFVSDEQYKIFTSIANSSVEVAPILYKYGVLGRYEDGNIEQVVGNRRASISIGYMGIAEVVERFGVSYATKGGQTLGLKVIKFMFDRINENKEKYNIALSLYGTPAESLTTKFAKACKDFDVIPRVNDRPEITNSYHIPVDTPINAFDKLDFEAPFQEYSVGGCISYIEVPDIRNNPQVVLTLMEYFYHNMVYCEINTRSCSKCLTCGFEGEITLHEDGTCSCPNCGETNPKSLKVILRTCGYMGEFQYGHTDGRWFNLMNRVLHL